MSVLNPIKKIDKTSMKCTDRAKITLSFESSSELVNRPIDLILVLDRSSSVSGSRYAFAKKGVLSLIDIVTKASGGVIDDTILSGSRIGIVSYATDATTDSALTNDVTALKNKIDSIKIGGNTNHEEAFTAALNLIDTASPNEQIVLMFTDGITTAGGDPDPVVDEIKKKGAEVYCIGLVDDDTNVLKWGSDPKDIHVVTTKDASRLVPLFNQIAYEAIKAGAKDVSILEKINPDFKIVALDTPTRGTLELKDMHTLLWTMQAAGVVENEIMEASFDIEYIGNTSGLKEVNESIVYSDRDGNTLDFGNASTTVDCDTVIVSPDECGEFVNFEVEGCTDSKKITIDGTTIKDLGRIVQVDFTISNVCPNKRLAAGIILTEIDENNIEHTRGMKALLIPGVVSDKCENVLVKCVSFVVPEELDVTGNVNSLCNSRNFKARVLVNYIDTDFVCCNKDTVIIK